MSSVIANFEIHYRQLLTPAGTLKTVPDFATQSHVQILYEAMVQTRLFDAKCIALQRTGKMGTYPSVLGQEAIGVGIGAAMLPTDVFCPYYRELGAQLWRGVRMVEIMAYWGGDERGSDFVGPRRDFPICVPIGSQTLHAVGVAAALQYQQRKEAVVTVVGDGGTSRGDFYESLNVAGVWQLPVVFVINNNGWAISVPVAQQTHAQTLAQKGFAAGIPSEQVDGNDVIVMQDAMQKALEKARNGGGPTVIEAITHRMGDHTTADDARRYRDEVIWKHYQALDPIKRLKIYLEQHHGWDEVAEQACKERCNVAIASAVAEYEALMPLPASEMFHYLYESLPVSYQDQLAEVKQLYG